jgi:hypothetical protein
MNFENKITTRYVFFVFVTCIEVYFLFLHLPARLGRGKVGRRSRVGALGSPLIDPGTHPWPSKWFVAEPRPSFEGVHHHCSLFERVVFEAPLFTCKGTLVGLVDVLHNSIDVAGLVRACGLFVHRHLRMYMCGGRNKLACMCMCMCMCLYLYFFPRVMTRPFFSSYILTACGFGPSFPHPRILDGRKEGKKEMIVK